ncbi:MAG TPA: single-stranded-DNA-specific exonuclease RecJ, partial [Alphaproteobacteria bacterium]|nr:single-stranded-DNA-specific exonuclease RecJ [Alphaproteobacteria bacterium]
MSLAPAFLNVRRSLNKARWVLADHDPHLSARMGQVHGLPDFVAQLLTARGVDLQSVESFLNPTLRRDFPDPSSLAGMEGAARRLADAIALGQQIAVFADFDVDGATSAGLLTRFLRAGGLDPLLYIPDRLKEGYGPNLQALQTLRARGADLVVL